MPYKSRCFHYVSTLAISTTLTKLKSYNNAYATYTITYMYIHDLNLNFPDELYVDLVVHILRL